MLTDSKVNSALLLSLSKIIVIDYYLFMSWVDVCVSLRNMKNSLCKECNSVIDKLLKYGINYSLL